MNHSPILRFSMACAMVILCAGCSIQWYDKETGTQHVLGLSHVVIRQTPPAEGVQSVVTGVEGVGLIVGDHQRSGQIALGWTRSHRLTILSENAKFRLEYEAWPSVDLTRVEVGSLFPGEEVDELATPVSIQPASGPGMLKRPQAELTEIPDSDEFETVSSRTVTTPVTKRRP